MFACDKEVIFNTSEIKGRTSDIIKGDLDEALFRMFIIDQLSVWKMTRVFLNSG